MSSRRSKLKSFFCFPSQPSGSLDSSEQSDPSSLPKHDDKVESREVTSHTARLPTKVEPTVSSKSSSASDEMDHHVRDQLKAFNIKNFNTLREVALVGIEGKPIDDKSYLMERIIQLAAELPVESGSSKDLTKAFLGQLWKDLQHPPQSYLGDEYRYRKPDGSYNNILWPHIGAAGQPYARSVQPKKTQPAARPDPGVVFDSVLVRKEFQPHPNRISSVLFYVATIIIHDIFHTSHVDFSKSETSSYLDLAPLYGSSQQDQDAIRLHKDGKLKPDCFSDKRVLGFPPGVGLLLIMFNRFHNQVAQNLAKIDQNGRFSTILNPLGRPPSPNAQELYDDALFQTARLITSGLYINIILKDYVRTILNLNRAGALWDLDPRSEEGSALFGGSIAQATGNQVSAEFNLVYRWHACISQRDTKWTEAEFEKLLGSNRQVTQSNLLRALQEWAVAIPADPQLRSFAELERNSEGSYPDDKLAALWAASVEDVAGSFGARHVPKVMRDVEILGIMQARSWNLASLNEFREYFKLQPHNSFESINPDPFVAQQLRHLYGHPDNVELYPGLIVESAKESKVPGSGLCTNFTISRAILSDAVALVRGDRFYTIDYTPQNLTNWGYEAAHYDLSVDDGCVFYKLVLNAFPQHYRQDSVYAHYPLTVPSETQAILNKIKKVDLYNFERPTASPVPVVLRSYVACSMILRDEVTFSSLWNPRSYFQDSDLVQNMRRHATFAKHFLDEPGWYGHTKLFYDTTIPDLLTKRSYEIAEMSQIDFIQDVLNAAHLQYIANILSLPLENEHSSGSTYDEQTLMSILDAIYLELDAQSTPEVQAASGQKRTNQIKRLASLIEKNVRSISKTSVLANAKALLEAHSVQNSPFYGRRTIAKLTDTGLSAEQIVWTELLPLAATMLVNLSRISAQCIAFLLDKEGLHMAQIQKLANQDSSDTETALEKYGLEAVRLSSSICVSRRVVKGTIVKDSAVDLKLRANQLVICDLSCSSKDEVDSPQDFRPTRNVEAYSWKGYGSEMDLLKEVSRVSVTALLKALCRTGDLSRVPGPQGQVKQLSGTRGFATYMDVEEREYVNCPRSMKIRWKNKTVT